MSSDAGPSRKRTRVDDGDAGIPNLLEKDKDVWLADGNIVVAADKVAFRVHKSILSLRSEFFRDLFSLPNADTATAETFDGCPVVHVSDSPDDIRHLFLVLCCDKNYYYSRGELISVKFKVLSSLIRMAHKYAIEDVLDDALFRLRKYYTNDLAAWQDSDSRAHYVTADGLDAPTVLGLARLTNTLPLLLSAFLVCAELAAGYWMGQDGTVRSILSSLSLVDQARVAGGKALLAQSCPTRMLRLLAAVPYTDCTTRGTCQAAREVPLDVLRDLDVLPGPPLSGVKALKPMAETFWSDVQWCRLCRGCREAAVETDEREIKHLWNSLPDIFAVEIDEGSWPGGEARTEQ